MDLQKELKLAQSILFPFASASHNCLSTLLAIVSLERSRYSSLGFCKSTCLLIYQDSIWIGDGFDSAVYGVSVYLFDWTL